MVKLVIKLQKTYGLTPREALALMVLCVQRGFATDYTDLSALLTCQKDAARATINKLRKKLPFEIVTAYRTGWILPPESLAILDAAI